MHGNPSYANPYASPRHDAPAAGRARRWKYHCPDCDAVCMSFWNIGIRRTDRLPRFPCPACGTVLQMHFDSKPGNRAVVFIALGLAALFLLLRAAWAWTPRLALWLLDRVDMAIVLPAVAAVAIVCVLWVLLRAGFQALSLRKLSDDAPAAQPSASAQSRVP